MPYSLDGLVRQNMDTGMGAPTEKYFSIAGPSDESNSVTAASRESSISEAECSIRINLIQYWGS